MNQYLDWMCCKITCVRGISTKPRKGGKTCHNFIIVFFNNFSPIIFSKKFVKNKGIKFMDISVGKILCIQPKIRGSIDGMHMINDLVLAKNRQVIKRKIPKSRIRLRIKSWSRPKEQVFKKRPRKCADVFS